MVAGCSAQFQWPGGTVDSSVSIMRCALCMAVISIAAAHPGVAGGSTDLLKTTSGSPVHWGRAQISIAVDAAASSRSVSSGAVDRAIERAAATWNAVHSGQPRLYLAVQDDADVHIAFCRGTWKGDTIDLGRAQFTADASDGSVSAASVEINECDHGFKTPDDGPSKGFDLQAVLTHELGHVLGLGHSTSSTAVMHPNGSGGAHLRKPTVDDQTALALLYFGRFKSDEAAAHVTSPAARHGASTATVASTTAPAPSNVDSPATDLVSVLRVTGNGGKQVMVYTCEPTLLPPLGSASPHGRATRQRGSRGSH